MGLVGEGVHRWGAPVVHTARVLCHPLHPEGIVVAVNSLPLVVVSVSCAVVDVTGVLKVAKLDAFAVPLLVRTVKHKVSNCTLQVLWHACFLLCEQLFTKSNRFGHLFVDAKRDQVQSVKDWEISRSELFSHLELKSFLHKFNLLALVKVINMFVAIEKLLDPSVLMRLKSSVHIWSLLESALFKITLFIEHLEFHCHQRVVKLCNLAVCFFQTTLLLLKSVNINWVLVRFIVGVLLIDAHSDRLIVCFSVDQETEDG